MLLATIPLSFTMLPISATTIQVLTILTGSSFASLRMKRTRDLPDALIRCSFGIWMMVFQACCGARFTIYLLQLLVLSMFCRSCNGHLCIGI
uniref:Uncharacterized protein n=1 Tax=Arundo donax TaxID=35708 RepID=A0A0A9DDP7_ARUDO